MATEFNVVHRTKMGNLSIIIAEASFDGTSTFPVNVEDAGFHLGLDTVYDIQFTGALRPNRESIVDENGILRQYFNSNNENVGTKNGPNQTVTMTIIGV